MEKLHFSVEINAPKQKVWDAMIGKETYKEWTAPFNASGSTYEGSWEKGASIRFVGPNPDGTVSGMFAVIEDNRPGEFISIRHLGEIINNEEKPWPAGELEGGVHENYTFREVDGKTEVLIDLDTNEQFKAMFEEMWPKSLEKLKEITERS